jgi:hypothetical protein
MLLVAATSAHAVVTRHDVADARYRVEDPEFPALVDMPHEGHGVLISNQWIVTAAHAATWHPVTSLSIHGACHPVAELIVHPGYRKPTKEQEAAGLPTLWAALAAMDDIALIKLAVPINDVTPVALYRGADEQGKLLKFYGKGATGTGLEGLGENASHRTELRRAYNYVSNAEGRWLSARFDAGPEAHALEGTSGNGDSGGPVLIESGGEWKLAGLTSWTFWDGDIAAVHPGKYGQVGKSVRVSHYAQWIDEVMRTHADDASAATGAAPAAR